MIVKWLADMVGGFITWFLNLLPDWQVPAWWTETLTWLEGIAAIRHFGNVIPLDAIAASAVALLAATVTVTAISGSRVVYSMFTGGGGAK